MLLNFSWLGYSALLDSFIAGSSGLLLAPQTMDEGQVRLAHLRIVSQGRLLGIAHGGAIRGPEAAELIPRTLVLLIELGQRLDIDNLAGLLLLGGDNGLGKVGDLLHGQAFYDFGNLLTAWAQKTNWMA